MIKKFLTLDRFVSVLIGGLLVFIGYEVYYYLQVLRWVDNIRLSEMLKQAAMAVQQAPKP